MMTPLLIRNYLRLAPLPDPNQLIEVAFPPPKKKKRKKKERIETGRKDEEKMKNDCYTF